MLGGKQVHCWTADLRTSSVAHGGNPDGACTRCCDSAALVMLQDRE
jgi:hypothetical protein